MSQMLSNQQMSELCLELSSLLHAGVGYQDAASLLHPRDPAARRVLKELELSDGVDLATAMESSQSFPPYACGLVRVGQEAGRTEEVLQALSTYYNKQYVRSRQIRSALAYPCMLLLLMLAVVAVLLIRVLPAFDEVYASLGGGMTGVAGSLLSFGRLLGRAAPALCTGLAVIVVGTFAAAMCPSVRKRAMGCWQAAFGDRGVSRKMNTAKLAQALSLSMEAGMPLDEAMGKAAELVSDVPAVRDRCLACAERLRSDERVSEALAASGVLPETACELLSLGQQSGGADRAMAEIASRLSFEADDALDSLVGKIEPSMILLSSLLVGMILLSVMLPLMDVMSAIC